MRVDSAHDDILEGYAGFPFTQFPTCLRTCFLARFRVTLETHCFRWRAFKRSDSGLPTCIQTSTRDRLPLNGSLQYVFTSAKTSPSDSAGRCPRHRPLHLGRMWQRLVEHR